VYRERETKNQFILDYLLSCIQCGGYFLGLLLVKKKQARRMGPDKSVKEKSELAEQLVIQIHCKNQAIRRLV
jgi:hypothetical protein